MATIKSDVGRTYEFIENIGGGGFGKISKVKCREDGKIYAFKFFPPPKDNDLEMRESQSNIRRIIKSLIEKPVTYRDGSKLENLVQPIEMVSKVPSATTPGKFGFGYIMDFKQVKDCGTIFKSWKKIELFRPDAKQMCEICIQIATIFDRIHASGRGYKDVNEGNIYFNIQTGQVYVIDCDNVAPENMSTIFGTVYYVAPEVFVTKKPNSVSDRYSMAVYFYRLMVGGYPLEGQRTIRFIMDHDYDDSNAQDAEKIYENTTLFAFDEKDTSNSIVNVKDTRIPDYVKNQWKIQASYWNILPTSIKEMFQKVFSENLKGPAKDRRPTETQWIRVFEDVLQNGIVKCSCGKHNYAENTNCLFCNKKLPERKKVEPVAKNAVKYKVVSGKNSGGEIFTDKLKNSDISSFFASLIGGKDVIIQSLAYSTIKKMMKIQNTSGGAIDIKYPNGVKTHLVNGGMAYVPLKSEIEFSAKGKATVKLSIEAFNA